ncbi:hypothetical protein AMTRI_Chr04g251290 [Amborella trichopoda]
MSASGITAAVFSVSSSLVASAKCRGQCGFLRKPELLALKPLRSFRKTLISPSRKDTVAMASISKPLEVCVKASTTTPNTIGDCPFCQRILLTLEEKHLPYDMKLIDLAKKPDWFLKINPEGKVPVLNLEDQWISDSDVIAQLLEEKYPEPSLATPPEKASVGSKIFSTFISYLKSKDPNDGTEQELLKELGSFNDYIKENLLDSYYFNCHWKSILALLGWKHALIVNYIYLKCKIPQPTPLITSKMKTGWQPKANHLSKPYVIHTTDSTILNHSKPHYPRTHKPLPNVCSCSKTTYHLQWPNKCVIKT